MIKYYGHGKPSLDRYNEKRTTRVEVASQQHLYLMYERLIKTKPWETIPTIDKAAAILKYNLENSSDAFTGYVNDTPFCMFGACPINEEIGQIWLLVTEDVHKVDLRFLKGSLYFIKFFKSVYKILQAVVEEEYEAAIKWLKWLGFEVIKNEDLFGTNMLRLELRA